MRRFRFISCAIVGLASTALHAEIILPGPSEMESRVPFGRLSSLDVKELTGASEHAVSDWARTSNLGSLGADLLILDYQSVAISPDRDPEDAVQLSVLGSDVRRTRSRGDVATRFFASSVHLWDGSQVTGPSSVQAYDLPVPTLNLLAPDEAASPRHDLTGPTSMDVIGSASLVGFVWN